jgi:hypothetical protein
MINGVAGKQQQHGLPILADDRHTTLSLPVEKNDQQFALKKHMLLPINFRWKNRR